MSEGTQGPHTLGWRTQGSTRATTRCGCPLAPLRLFFGLRLVSGDEVGMTPRVLDIGLPAAAQKQDGHSKPKKSKTN
jgi:hypothetical protein